MGLSGPIIWLLVFYGFMPPFIGKHQPPLILDPSIPSSWVCHWMVRTLLQDYSAVVKRSNFSTIFFGLTWQPLSSWASSILRGMSNWIINMAIVQFHKVYIDIIDFTLEFPLLWQTILHQKKHQHGKSSPKRWISQRPWATEAKIRDKCQRKNWGKEDARTDYVGMSWPLCWCSMFLQHLWCFMCLGFWGNCASNFHFIVWFKMRGKIV